MPSGVTGVHTSCDVVDDCLIVRALKGAVNGFVLLDTTGEGSGRCVGWSVDDHTYPFTENVHEDEEGVFADDLSTSEVEEGDVGLGVAALGVTGFGVARDRGSSAAC